MEWYLYIASFFAGVFLANAVPHFVHGISGDRFPTPFANPPGKGLSSPALNVVWALGNLLIGSILFHVGQIRIANVFSFAVFFIGVSAISIVLSINFKKKDTA